jgi:hypothetical protein
MSEIGDKLEELTANIKEYVNIQYKLATLKAGGMASTIGAKIVAIFILALIFFLFLIFISITVGLYISTLVGSREKGFLILSAIYFVKGIILFVFREKLLIGPIRNSFIKQIFKDDE